MPVSKGERKIILATNIAETQAQSYADLASMLAQTVGSSFVDKSGEVVAEVSKADEAAIKEQLSKLSSEQKNNLSSIGKALEEVEKDLIIIK